MRSRAVVSYEDLPHDASVLQHAAVEAVAPVAKKRRKQEQEPRYHGPHWDEVGPSTAKAAPGWSETPDDDERISAGEDSDDVMVASPTHEEPFLEEVEVPSGDALLSKEVWDDRFLLDAWNAAEEEYATFHQRRTEAIDALLSEKKEGRWYTLPTPEVQDAAGTEQHEDEDDEEDEEEAEEEQHEDEKNGEHDDQPANTPTAGWIQAARIVAATPNQIGGTPETVPSLPSLALPAGVQGSETLQSLMMAWYYTGYYTALYQQEQNPNPHSLS